MKPAQESPSPSIPAAITAVMDITAVDTIVHTPHHVGLSITMDTIVATVAVIPAVVAGIKLIAIQRTRSWKQGAFFFVL